MQRYDFGKPNLPPELYMTQLNAGGVFCVGCHVMSRDGDDILVGKDFPAPAPYAIYAAQAANAAQFGGLNTGAFLRKEGDTMTGPLNQPTDGLTVGGSQFFVSGANTYVGYALNVDHWGNSSNSLSPSIKKG
mgnify:CR=1 FL=1